MRNLTTGRRWPLRAILPSLLLIVATGIRPAGAQCTETPFQNYTGAGTQACPCFAVGEQAGAVFQLPASEYPIEILKVGIGWGSAFGGSGQSVEQAIHIYEGGLPNPGTPIFTLLGPQLTDGVINEYNLGILPGEIVIDSGPFTVTLEFLNENANNFFVGTMVNDGNGCQPGKNVVWSGAWFDACNLGVTGDWVVFVKYRSLKVTASGTPATTTFSNVPFNQATYDTVFVTNTGCDTLSIAGIAGCNTGPFAIDTTMTSHLVPPGGQTPIVVSVTPTSATPVNCQIVVTSNAGNSPTVFDVELDGVTAVGDTPSNGFEITGVFPNPFNPEATIRFTLPRELAVTAEVWSVSGARVRTLASGRTFAAGENALRWDGRNGAGAPVASGVYLVRVETALGRRVTRAVLIE